MRNNIYALLFGLFFIVVTGIATALFCEQSNDIPNRNAHNIYNYFTAMQLDSLFAAIEQIESAGQSCAIGDGGEAVGPYQLHTKYLVDVNRIILKLNCPDTVIEFFDDHDRYDKLKCQTMMIIYWSYYLTEIRLGRAPTLEDLVRTHNGGPNGWRKSSTISYWDKVKNEYDRQ